MTMTKAERDEYLAIRKQAALQIDAETADVNWWWANELDPYGTENADEGLLHQQMLFRLCSWLGRMGARERSTGDHVRSSAEAAWSRWTHTKTCRPRGKSRTELKTNSKSFATRLWRTARHAFAAP